MYDIKELRLLWLIESFQNIPKLCVERVKHRGWYRIWWYLHGKKPCWSTMTICTAGEINVASPLTSWGSKSAQKSEFQILPYTISARFASPRFRTRVAKWLKNSELSMDFYGKSFPEAKPFLFARKEYYPQLWVSSKSWKGLESNNSSSLKAMSTEIAISGDASRTSAKLPKCVSWALSPTYSLPNWEALEINISHSLLASGSKLLGHEQTKRAYHTEKQPTNNAEPTLDGTSPPLSLALVGAFTDAFLLKQLAMSRNLLWQHGIGFCQAMSVVLRIVEKTHCQKWMCRNVSPRYGIAKKESTCPLRELSNRRRRSCCCFGLWITLRVAKYQVWGSWNWHGLPLKKSIWNLTWSALKAPLFAIMDCGLSWLHGQRSRLHFTVSTQKTQECAQIPQ